MPRLRGFWTNESGATAIEYAVIATLVSISIFASASLIGTRLSSRFAQVANNLT